MYPVKPHLLSIISGVLIMAFDQLSMQNSHLLKKGSVVKSFKINLPIKGFIIKNLNEFFAEEDGDSVQVELKNPKLPKNHFANQFRFWGCTVIGRQ